MATKIMQEKPKRKRMGGAIPPEELAQKKAECVEAMNACLGIISQACKKIGITRKTFYSWLENDPEFKEQIEQTYETQKDFVESSLLKKIKEGDSSCTIFYLKTRAKDRGYSERFEITGNDGGAINTNVTTTFSDVLTAMAQGRVSK